VWLIGAILCLPILGGSGRLVYEAHRSAPGIDETGVVTVISLTGIALSVTGIFEGDTLHSNRPM
jgi:hypothetical protein